MANWKKRIEIVHMALENAIKTYEEAKDELKMIVQVSLNTITKHFGNGIYEFLEKIAEADIEKYTNLQLRASSTYFVSSSYF